MIYLDNNATTQIAPEVLEAMAECLAENFGNPSSAHAAGRSARKITGNARESVANLLGGNDLNEIVFTSGGTESDNWAILGSIEASVNKNKKHIITTGVEHEAVRKVCERLERQGFRVTWLDVDEEGSLDLEQLRDSLNTETVIVSVMMANNETGVVFPVADISEIVKSYSNALFHVDGVNAAGKIAIDLKKTAIDLFSISAHKFHGPKGIGALYVRQGVELSSMLIGGGQESGRRAGTEAVHQIAGLGEAARLSIDLSVMERIRQLRDRLESKIISTIPNTTLNGTADTSRRLPNTSNISFENTNGEMILSRLDDEDICVSTGSACNSESRTASPVLQAMNVPYSKAMGSIRFSLGRANTEQEIDIVLERLPGIIEELNEMSRGLT
jgi:cysteine desulfurase